MIEVTKVETVLETFIPIHQESRQHKELLIQLQPGRPRMKLSLNRREPRGMDLWIHFILQQIQWTTMEGHPCQPALHDTTDTSCNPDTWTSELEEELLKQRVSYRF